MQTHQEAAVKVMVVDDDSRLQELTKTFLESFSYLTHHVYSGDTLDSDVESIRPDIILLDIMMPGKDGLTALQQLRKVSNTPVIMVSARTEDMDRILSLEMGADDYISKPFNPYELMARIKSVLRRTGRRDSQEPAELPFATITYGEITLDGMHQQLVYKGIQGKLTTAEYRILLLLMRHQGRILSRERLASEVSGNGYVVNERNIDVHVCRIRNVCKRLGIVDTHLRTIRGAGYCWADNA